MKKEILEIKDFVLNISEKWIQTNRKGDTGVGKTFEDYLGVEENNSKGSDYKGIELKCFRKGKEKKSLQTLCTMEPQWVETNSRETILNNYGYISDDGKTRLNTSITNIENNLGWSLKFENGYLNILNYGVIVAKYDIKSIIKKFLITKLKDLVTIGTDVKKKNGKEYFNYNQMKYFTGISGKNISKLISEGKLKIEFRMTSKKNYGTAFRINRKYLTELYETCVEVV